MKYQSDWHIKAVDGTEFGPFSLGEFPVFIAQRRLLSTSLVKHSAATNGKWMKASDVPVLRALFPEPKVTKIDVAPAPPRVQQTSVDLSPKPRPTSPRRSDKPSVMPYVITALACCIGVVAGLVIKDKFFPSSTERIASSIAAARTQVLQVDSDIEIVAGSVYRDIVFKRIASSDIGYVVFVSIQNKSREVKSTCPIHARIRREGRPLPDTEAYDIVEIKGGMKPGEQLDIKASFTEGELDYFTQQLSEERLILEASTDKKKWFEIAYKLDEDMQDFKREADSILQQIPQ